MEHGEVNLVEGIQEFLREVLGEEVVLVDVIHGGWKPEVVVEHQLGEVLGEAFRMCAEVDEHGVRFPSAEKPDDVVVGLCVEQGSGTAGAETAGRKLPRRDPCVRL